MCGFDIISNSSNGQERIKQHKISINCTISEDIYTDRFEMKLLLA